MESKVGEGEEMLGCGMRSGGPRRRRRGASHVSAARHGDPHLLFIPWFSNPSSSCIFCFTSLDIWDELSLLWSLLTLNFMTSCSGLPPAVAFLPLGNYVCPLASGHSGECRDSPSVQPLSAATGGALSSHLRCWSLWLVLNVCKLNACVFF